MSRLSDPSSKANRVWYGGLWPGILLLPFAGVYGAVAACLRRASQPKQFSVPVVVVGNITVGGNGKTPLLIHLVDRLKAQGARVGIVSRGYAPGKRGKATRVTYPHRIREGDDAGRVGDEAVLIHEKTQCPVVVAPKRSDAVRQLLSDETIDVVLSDDGLQHYDLHRDLEIVVVNGAYGFGNGLRLPAGPLRESVKRLDHARFIVFNGGAKNHFRLEPVGFTHARTGERRGSDYFAGRSIHACAGIGHPESFFRMLEDLDVRVTPHAFADHTDYTADMLRFTPRLPVVMTEKDMVKCRAFSSLDGEKLDLWTLETRVLMHPEMEQQIVAAVTDLIKTKQTETKREGAHVD